MHLAPASATGSPPFPPAWHSLQETSSKIVATQVQVVSVDGAAGGFKYWVPTDWVAKLVVLSGLCCEVNFGLEARLCDDVSPLAVHTLHDDEIDGW